MSYPGSCTRAVVGAAAQCQRFHVHADCGAADQQQKEKRTYAGHSYPGGLGWKPSRKESTFTVGLSDSVNGARQRRTLRFIMLIERCTLEHRDVLILYDPVYKLP